MAKITMIATAKKKIFLLATISSFYKFHLVSQEMQCKSTVIHLGHVDYSNMLSLEYRIQISIKVISLSRLCGIQAFYYINLTIIMCCISLY